MTGGHKTFGKYYRLITYEEKLPHTGAPFLKGATHKLVTEPPTGKEKAVPKLLHACVPEDPGEESKIRQLAGTRHAPGDWILRAGIASLSWQGLRTSSGMPSCCRRERSSSLVEGPSVPPWTRWGWIE